MPKATRNVVAGDWSAGLTFLGWMLHPLVCLQEPRVGMKMPAPVRALGDQGAVDTATDDPSRAKLKVLTSSFSWFRISPPTLSGLRKGY